jgi:tetratricopeptide (TPR) repeat protein
MSSWATVAAADDPPSRPAAATENWATARARALTEEGARHRTAGRTDLAIARFVQALEMDGTFGAAYLGLAEVREATGEIEEAERVLALGLDRIPGFTDGLRARAGLLARAKRLPEAVESLRQALASAPNDPIMLRELIDLAVRARRLPVALAAARRLSTVAHSLGDGATARDAAVTAIALGRLLADTDPVTSARKSPDAVRRAIARAADPRGR